MFLDLFLITTERWNKKPFYTNLLQILSVFLIDAELKQEISAHVYAFMPAVINPVASYW